MKKACLNLTAKISREGIKAANNSACFCWSYQPKAPKSLKKIKLK